MLGSSVGFGLGLGQLDDGAAEPPTLLSRRPPFLLLLVLLMVTLLSMHRLHNLHANVLCIRA